MIKNSILLNINNKIKEKVNKNKLKKYYLEKSQDGKTLMAIFLDAVLFRIFIVLVLFFILYYNSNTLWFSAVITVQFLILYMIFERKIKNIKFEKNIKLINNLIAKEKIHKDYINQTPDNFITSIKENLEKCNFRDLTYDENKGIDLVGTFNNRIIGIKCYQYNLDYKVSFNNIREFFLALRDKELDEGIIITTSTISKDAKDFLIRLKSYKKIVTIDINDLIVLMKKSGTYPSQKEIEKVILSEISEKKSDLLNTRKGVLNEGKGIKYFFLSGIIFFFGKLTPYKRYYEIVAVILLTLGILVFIKLIYNFLKDDKKENNEAIFENY